MWDLTRPDDPGTVAVSIPVGGPGKWVDGVAPSAEVGSIAEGSKAQAVEMLTMAPPFCACMTGATSRTARTTFRK